LSQVLHADFISFAAGPNADALEEVLRAAAGLAGLPGVEGVLAIEAMDEGDFDAGVFFLLSDLGALESFGADQRYTAFLQRVVAPLLGGLAGADVRTEGEAPAAVEQAACLALVAPPHAYDWEVKNALTAWQDRASGRGMVGMAVGERQRFRGLALAGVRSGEAVTRPEIKGFAVSMISGRLRVLA
jgi:hypothetical protein